ncbi:uncharacterized protein CTRU02_200270 [Colletotrichum truncatum]|uniref:Uncharacterized protein n=1 Tax=Colletotrichum truncatum TaxID=5467 RepID=A0ACC3ZE88_COLTU|nr:uncharacterized protein CTRU02_00024 [Colletotrichum truncatum]KAF6801275.1 hypothetical protein CTRU02_00024 [Colletotrichum truncatum]
MILTGPGFGDSFVPARHGNLTGKAACPSAHNRCLPLEIPEWLVNAHRSRSCAGRMHIFLLGIRSEATSCLQCLSFLIITTQQQQHSTESRLKNTTLNSILCTSVSLKASLLNTSKVYSTPFHKTHTSLKMSPAFAARTAARMAIQRRQFSLLTNMRNVARSFEPHPFQRMSQTGVHAKPFYGAMIQKRLVTAAMFFPLASFILGWPYLTYLLFDGRM